MLVSKRVAIVIAIVIVILVVIVIVIVIAIVIVFSQRVCNACIPKIEAADTGGVDKLSIDVQIWLRQQSELLPSATLALMGARGPPSKTFFMCGQSPKRAPPALPNNSRAHLT